MQIYVATKITSTNDIRNWVLSEISYKKRIVSRSMYSNMAIMSGLFFAGMHSDSANILLVSGSLILKLINYGMKVKNIDLLTFYACVSGLLNLCYSPIHMFSLLIPLILFSYKSSFLPMAELVKVSSMTSIVILIISTLISQNASSFKALQVSLFLYNFSISDKCTSKDARYLLLYKILMNMEKSSPCLNRFLLSPFALFKVIEGSRTFHIEANINSMSKPRFVKKTLVMVLLDKWMDSQIQKLQGLDSLMTLLFGWLHSLGFYPPFLKVIAGSKKQVGRQKLNVDVQSLAKWAISKQNYVKTTDGIVKTLFLLYRHRLDKMTRKERKLAYQFSNIPHFSLGNSLIEALKKKILKDSQYLPAVFNVDYEKYSAPVEVLTCLTDVTDKNIDKSGGSMLSRFKGVDYIEKRSLLKQELVVNNGGSCFFKLKSSITKRENFKELHPKAKTISFLSSPKTLISRNTNCVYRRKFKIKKQRAQLDVDALLRKPFTHGQLAKFSKGFRKANIPVCCLNYEEMLKLDKIRQIMIWNGVRRLRYLHANPAPYSKAAFFVHSLMRYEERGEVELPLVITTNFAEYISKIENALEEKERLKQEKLAILKKEKEREAKARKPTKQQKKMIKAKENLEKKISKMKGRLKNKLKEGPLKPFSEPLIKWILRAKTKVGIKWLEIDYGKENSIAIGLRESLLS